MVGMSTLGHLSLVDLTQGIRSKPARPVALLRAQSNDYRAQVERLAGVRHCVLLRCYFGLSRNLNIVPLCITGDPHRAATLDTKLPPLQLSSSLLFPADRFVIYVCVLTVLIVLFIRHFYHPLFNQDTTLQHTTVSSIDDAAHNNLSPY